MAATLDQRGIVRHFERALQGFLVCTADNVYPEDLGSMTGPKNSTIRGLQKIPMAVVHQNSVHGGDSYGGSPHFHGGIDGCLNFCRVMKSLAASWITQTSVSLSSAAMPSRTES